MARQRKVQFQRLAAAPDDLGNVTDGTWSPFLTVWGEYRPERSTERLEAARTEASVAGVLIVRSSSDTRAVTEADRVVIRGVAHNIRGIVNPDQMDRYLHMRVERGVAT